MRLSQFSFSRGGHWTGSGTPSVSGVPQRDPLVTAPQPVPQGLWAAPQTCPCPAVAAGAKAVENAGGALDLRALQEVTGTPLFAFYTLVWLLWLLTG